MKPAIQVNQLTVRYPEFHTDSISDISFTLMSGTITALIGPNGSGKTTLIKALLGLIPYQGTIKFNGQTLKEAVGKIGYVPQRFSIDTSFPITVTEFLDLALITCQDDQVQKSKRITTALEMVQINQTATQSLQTLSGGQLQRLLVARALIHEPKILILDEPEAGIDAQGEEIIYTLLHTLSDKGLTILVASHELDIVSSLADQVICINHQLICQGEPKSILSQKTFQQLYGHELKLYGHRH